MFQTACTALNFGLGHKPDPIGPPNETGGPYCDPARIVNIGVNSVNVCTLNHICLLGVRRMRMPCEQAKTSVDGVLTEYLQTIVNEVIKIGQLVRVSMV